MNEPAIAAIALMPSAVPRRVAGNASVMIAVELANSNAPPTPWAMRQPINHRAAADPWRRTPKDSNIEHTLRYRGSSAAFL